MLAERIELSRPTWKEGFIAIRSSEHIASTGFEPMSLGSEPRMIVRYITRLQFILSISPCFFHRVNEVISVSENWG